MLLTCVILTFVGYHYSIWLNSLEIYSRPTTRQNYLSRSDCLAAELSLMPLCNYYCVCSEILVATSGRIHV